MRDHIIEITQEGRYVSLYRGFLVISSKTEELTRVPLDDLQALICGCSGILLTSNVLAELASKGIPVIISGEKYLPNSILWPMGAHHALSLRIASQIHAPAALKKRLWQKIIRAKIEAQSSCLYAKKLDHDAKKIKKMITKVRSGDPNNIEAHSARLYWNSLFGNDFTRDNSTEYPINVFLNYGYAILRSCTARACAAAGLHPAIGIFHSNRFNPFCLVDDLMEPFRPIIDLYCFSYFKDLKDISNENKRQLASILRMDLETENGKSPISVCIQRLATSVALSFEQKSLLIKLPFSLLPITPIKEPCSADIDSCG
jgi:CRISPR-associated protein Cas1